MPKLRPRKTFTDLLTWIYFVESGVGADRVVKIGRSGELYLRLSQIKANCALPVKLVCAVRAYDFVEAALHDLFDDECAHGEWFRVSKRIDALILALSAEHQGKRVPAAKLIEVMRATGAGWSIAMDAWYRRIERTTVTEGGAKPQTTYPGRDIRLLISLGLLPPGAFTKRVSSGHVLETGVRFSATL